MTYTKSSFPYLCVLLFFVIAIPLLNLKLESSQRIVVEVKAKVDIPNKKVFAQQKKSTPFKNQLPAPLLIMSK